ncbi:coiled-coil domain-containing protein [Sulfurimonas sp. ST-27]|uniref:coiled-coil domain-containing protein n=1 Tax=Sulfurimonas sp. ST-27 TaxID=3400152 RepID=UPI003AB80078
MKKYIKFNSILLEDENSFLNALKQITINHIYDLEDDSDCQRLFVNITLLPDEIIALRDNFIQQIKDDLKISDAEFHKFDERYHVSTVLYNHLEDIILSEKLQQIKKQTIKTKISTTNLLLVSILKTINSEGKYGQSSEKTYDLKMGEVNDELYRYCYAMQELEYRNQQKKYEQNFLKLKAKLLQKESLFRQKYISQHQKLKRKREALEQDIDQLEYQIVELKKIENESISEFSEFDIEQYESYNEDFVDSDIDTELLLPSSQLDDIEKLEKRLKNLKSELEKLDVLPRVDENEYQKKIDNLYEKNNNELKGLREKVVQNCQETEDLIAKNKMEEEAFFNQLVNKDAILQSDWNTYLYIPVKKSTSKSDKKNLSNSNPCIVSDNIEKKRKKDLIFRSLQYLEAYNILHKESISDEKYVKYTINLESSQEHPVRDTEVLDRLLELLSAYLKFNSTSNVKSFWQHIDWLIEYWMQDPRLYSTVAQHELAILDAYNEGLAITIKTKKKKYFHNIIDFSLSFDGNMDKIVVFSYDNQEITLKLLDITHIEIKEQERDKTDQKFTQQQQFKSHLSKYKIPDRGESKVILMADISHSDFFDMRPLKNQIIYKTENEIKSFLKNNGIEEVHPNKIYIEAVDTQNKVIYTVKRCIPHVKILEPTVIKEKFNDIIKSMCDEI